MHIRSAVRGLLALLALSLCSAAGAQVTQPAKAGPALTGQDLRNLLVWNSPWEGRAAVPGRLYSYRTSFHVKRDTVIAEVISYATNQRSDSVVEFRDGRLVWQDANGAEVSVALVAAGDLVGMAKSQSASLPIVLKPRP